MARHSEKDRMIFEWMIEYVYKMAFETFENHKSVDYDHIRDVSQWLLQLPIVPEISKCSHSSIVKVQLLLLMSRLTDGKEFNSRYSQEQEVTILEDMLVHFNSMLDSLSFHLLIEGEDLLPIIKKEAVLVCCRAQEFDEARNVFDRIWGGQTDKHLQATKNELNKLIVQQECPSNDNSYESFVDEIIRFVSKINQEFEVPYLEKLADVKLERKKKRKESEWKNSRRPQKVSRLEIFNVCQELNLELDTNSLVPTESKQKEMISCLNSNARLEETENVLTQVCPTETVFKSPLPKSPSSTVPLNENRRKSEDSALHDTAEIPRYRRNMNRKDRHKTDIEDIRMEEGNGESPAKRPKTSATLTAETLSQYDTVNSSTDTVKRRIPSPSVSSVSCFSKNRVKWTARETEEFYQAVQECGVGAWAAIKKMLDTDRSNVHLKDRWRSINKNGEINRLIEKFGPV